MPAEHIKELILKMADDALIIGHRYSEWTGIGPTLEEDISFSSIAQDKLGHALQLYTILHKEFGEKDPDTLAFRRDPAGFRCAQFTELPIGMYEFSLMRHLLFDHAESARYQMLASSSYIPLAQLSRKIHGEIKYHILHADTWVTQLGTASADSNYRLQAALNETYGWSLGLFEPGNNEAELVKEKIFDGEKALHDAWFRTISVVLNEAKLIIPEDVKPTYGGRRGNHTEYLKPLIDEMAEVIRLEQQATW